MNASADRIFFASDNGATIHAEVMAALHAANQGHAFGYGADPWTTRAHAALRAHLGEQADPFLVFNGTAANTLVIAHVARPWQAVICAAGAHINVDECGAPEKFGATKLVLADSHDGKLTPETLARAIHGVGDVHHVQPRLVSISQSTELGTVYSPGEVRALADAAHKHNLLLHVDGARLSNAAASLGVPLRAITTDAGVDVVSVGGTKNGLMAAEAVVFLRPELGRDFPYVRKQGMQLASKMRFMAAQFVALLEGDLWQRNARHANAMARLLESLVKGIPGVDVTRPVQANAVFARLPRAWIPRLLERFQFYTWDEATSEVRWMCAHDTTEEQVRALAAAVKGLATA